MKPISFLSVSLALAAVSSLQAVPIYTNDFESSSSAGFSSSTISTTPSGTKFLGQFDNSTVTFSQGGVGIYSSLTIEFDLYVIQSWDGNGPFGPDHWAFGINGVTQLDTTFDNVGNNQSYPGPYVSTNPSRTGAAANNTLGYGFYGDSTYHFSYTIANSANLLTLSFAGSNLQGVNDEGWGLDNVKIEGTLRHVPDAASTAGLLVLGVGALATLRRKLRS